MHIHEYQAKELLRAYGIPTPQGRLARSHVEALEAARAMPGPVWVVKAQIHAGGRGKGRRCEDLPQPGRGWGGRRVLARQPSGDPPDRAERRGRRQRVDRARYSNRA